MKKKFSSLEGFELALLENSVNGKKSPNVYKSCPKNDFTRKMIAFDTFTKIA